MKYIFAVASMVALSACSGGPKIVVEGIPVRVPPDLKECASKPAKPTGDFTQKDVARLLKRYEAAHADCKEDLKALNEVVGTHNKKVSGVKAKKK